MSPARQATNSNLESPTHVRKDGFGERVGVLFGVNMLTQTQVKELFDYQEDGQFTWKVSNNTKIRIGDVAGGFNKSCGYPCVRVHGVQYILHRLIFLWHHGHLPKFIDHVDGTRSNNRINNLRECTHQQNMFNRKSSPKSSSKHKGVYLHKSSGKWVARSTLNGELKQLGRFNSEMEAALAYDEHARAHHGEFAKLNIKPDCENT
jgi:hypothetical protein